MFLLKTPKELYEKYEYLVPITVGKNFPNNSYRDSHMLDLDDIYQFGRIGLYEACQRYDANKGKSFRNFAIDSIIWKIKNEAKKYSLRSINTYSNELIDSVSLNVAVTDNFGEECYLQDTIEDEVDEIEKALIKNSLKSIKNKLPNNLYKILVMRMNKYTYEEIAEELGVTRQNVQRLVNMNKDKVIKLMELDTDGYE